MRGNREQPLEYAIELADDGQEQEKRRQDAGRQRDDDRTLLSRHKRQEQQGKEGYLGGDAEPDEEARRNRSSIRTLSVGEQNRRQDAHEGGCGQTENSLRGGVEDPGKSSGLMRR